jgi:hypothetical protein
MWYLVLAFSSLAGAAAGWVMGKIVDEKSQAGCPVNNLAGTAAVALIAGWLGMTILGWPGIFAALPALVSLVILPQANRAFDRAYPSKTPAGSGYPFYAWVALWASGAMALMATRIEVCQGWQLALATAVVGALPLALAAYGLSRIAYMVGMFVFDRLVPVCGKYLNVLGSSLTDLGARVSAALPCGRHRR